MRDCDLHHQNSPQNGKLLYLKTAAVPKGVCGGGGVVATCVLVGIWYINITIPALLEIGLHACPRAPNWSAMVYKVQTVSKAQTAATPASKGCYGD